VNFFVKSFLLVQVGVTFTVNTKSLYPPLIFFGYYLESSEDNETDPATNFRF